MHHLNHLKSILIREPVLLFQVRREKDQKVKEIWHISI